MHNICGHPEHITISFILIDYFSHLSLRIRHFRQRVSFVTYTFHHIISEVLSSFSSVPRHPLGAAC
jgi:hypothetical protein